MFSRLLTLTLTALITLPAGAQEQRALTVEQAVQVGLENSKILRQSQGRVAYADARAAEVNASSLPSLKFGGSYTRLSNLPPFQISIPFLPPPFPTSFTLSPTILDNYNLRLSFQHPLFTGFKLDAAKDAADWTVEATNQNYTKDKSDLIFNIESAYWNLFRAREFLKLADENVEQLNAHLSDVKNLLDQGMATTNDRLAVEVQLSNGQLGQVDARNNVQLALVALDNTLGIPLSTDIRIASQVVDSARESPPLDMLIRTGMEARPEIKSMSAQVKASEAGVTAARSGWWPQIFLTGNYYYAKPNQRLLPAQDIFKDTWDFGVGVSLDIWNWGTTVHQTDEAQAQLAQAREAYGQVEDGVSLDVTQAYLTLQQAHERVSVTRQGLALAEENHRVTNQRYKEGLVLNSDMLNAQYALNGARTNYTQALVDSELAQARLEKAIGKQ